MVQRSCTTSKVYRVLRSVIHILDRGRLRGCCPSVSHRAVCTAMSSDSKATLRKTMRQTLRGLDSETMAAESTLLCILKTWLVVTSLQVQPSVPTCYRATSCSTHTEWEHMYTAPSCARWTRLRSSTICSRVRHTRVATTTPWHHQTLRCLTHPLLCTRRAG